MRYVKTILLLVLFAVLITVDGRSKRYKKKSMILRQKETNVVNFIR